MKCKKCRHFYTVMVTKEGYNPFPCCHLWEDEGDRKSTRLNSSHQF